MSICSRKLIACLTYFCSRNAGGEGVGFVFGQIDETVLDRSDLASQLCRVRGLEQRGKLGGFIESHSAVIHDSLVWGAGFVVNAPLLAVLI